MNARIEVPAPAKINLYLRVTGRRADGYHEIDSLVAFATAGDVIRIEPAPVFSFSIEGPFAETFSDVDSDGGAGSGNLCVRAARGLAALAGRPPEVSLRLTKNLPLAAGIGGGSADAAAVIRGLTALWGIDAAIIPGFADFVLRLGADVLVCMAGVPQRVTGIGEKCAPVYLPADLPAVLVNPRVACPTAGVFAAFARDFSAFDPAGVAHERITMNLLEREINGLTAPAIALVPEIADILELLASQPECRFARMSGSGATCFGIFATPDAAQLSAAVIAAARPDWWVVPTLINPETDGDGRD